MKAAKPILFFAGLLGFVGLFLPLFAAGRGPVRMTLSARDLSFGLARTHQLIDAPIPGFVQKRIPRQVLSDREDVRMIAHASRFAALAFVPATVMLLLAIAALWYGRFGRRMAGAAVLCGLASVGAYFGLRYGLAYGAAEEPVLERADLALRIGASLLIVSGIGGVIGGVLGLVRPEVPRRHTSTPLPMPPPPPPPPGPAPYG